MSDFNSSLPVRTEAPGDVQVKIVDSTVTSQQLTVNPDGSINAVVSATNLDIRDLAFTTDKVDVTGSTVDATGSVIDVTGSIVALDAPTIAALQTVTVANGAGASAVNIQDGGNSITVDGTVAISGSVIVTATDLDIRDLTPATDKVAIGDGTDTLAINADGSINVVVSSGTPGTSINNYNTASAIAGGATSNHDYTVTSGKTLSLNQIEASGSGKMKIEVQIESGVSTNTFATRFVQFNSTASPNMGIQLADPILVAAGVRVRIIRTNKEGSSQDLYSTISGSES